MNPETVKEFIAKHPKCDCPLVSCEQHGKCFECGCSKSVSYRSG